MSLYQECFLSDSGSMHRELILWRSQEEVMDRPADGRGWYSYRTLSHTGLATGPATVLRMTIGVKMARTTHDVWMAPQT